MRWAAACSLDSHARRRGCNPTTNPGLAVAILGVSVRAMADAMEPKTH
jgi:hypothetical protein